MEISWYIILNIISIIIIRGCKGIQEKPYKNLINDNAELDNYISVNISSHDVSNYFHIISTELSGVDTVLLFPKNKIKIGKILDNNSILWKKIDNQKFILGMISSSSYHNMFAINLIIKCINGIKYNTFLLKSNKYEIVPIFQYLDGFSLLKPIYSSENFTLDLSKAIIPEILDINTIIDKYKINLFIPYRKYRATIIKFGNNKIFDGTSDNSHIPIIIGYIESGITYINMFVAQGNEDFGYIYKYKLLGNEFVFIYKSDKKGIYEIFTHKLGNLLINNKPKDSDYVDKTKIGLKRSNGFIDTKSINSTSIDTISDIEDIEIPKISVDILNINSKYIKTEKHKIFNMETIKYIPIGAIITSVKLNEKILWSFNDNEIKCIQIIINSISEQKQSLELSIQKKDGEIVNRIIPYISIIEYYKSQNKDIYGQLKVPSSLKTFLELKEDNINDNEQKIEEKEYIEEEDEDDDEEEDNVFVEPKILNKRRKSSLKIKIPIKYYYYENKKNKEDLEYIEDIDTKQEKKNISMESTPPNSPARASVKNQGMESTPPNSPARASVKNQDMESTPPNSPARASPKNQGIESTPPNSPARASPKNQAEIPPNSPVGIPPNSPVGIPPNSPVDVPPNSPVDIPPNSPVDIPPNSPVDVPPNTPVETPPPSPARTPKNSLSFDELSYVDLERIRTNIYKPEEYQTVKENKVEKEYIEDGELPSTSDEITPSEIRSRNLFLEESDNSEIIYNKEKEYIEDIDNKHIKNDILDISSRKSIKKMNIIDGTLLIPFIILFPREKYPIRSIYDGKQCIWKNTNENQIIKYISLYVKNNKPLAMSIMIFYTKIRYEYKYYLKDINEWFEVSAYDYDISTHYEFKNINKENKIKEKEVNKNNKGNNKKENVLHVSIMIPVILGTLFLVLWVCSMLFIVFFL